MMSKKIMLCEAGDQMWTQEALHLACALARTTQAELVLVEMLPAQHYSWLGTDFGIDFDPKRMDLQREYASIVEDYGVNISIQPFQYHTLADAIVEAAECVEAEVVFATLPSSKVSLWRKFQMRRLQRQLAHQNRHLFTLEQPNDAAEWTPTIQMAHASK